MNSSLNLPSEKCAAFRIAISNGESQLGFPNCRIMLRQHLVQLVNIARLACLISPESGEKEKNGIAFMGLLKNGIITPEEGK